MDSFDDDFDNNINIDPMDQINELVNATKVHIRIQKRNARKSICTIEGLEGDQQQLKDILKHMKKTFGCNGNYVNNEKHGNVLQLQGDIREKAKEMLISKYEYNVENIVIHGSE
ncbi:Translation initiation factor SUI1 [seawater metagenome]|uniref:Translation initiation factor SUI1 n=1 Tax=seawater metagenome TaxID=1561972 RepID=A0A5E8CK68_9ZZZZ